MPVDPTTDKRFSTLFIRNEQEFLKGFFPEHPYIEGKFNAFLDMPAAKRPDAATAAIKALPRKGWHVRGVKEQESVYEHTTELSVFLDTALPFLLRESGYSSPEAGKLYDKVKAMAKVHDMHEAIATDFIPGDKISDEDKHKIELLAARVIFEKSPTQYDLVKEYIEQETPAAYLLHDFDKIHAVMKAAAIEVREPEQKGKLFDGFLAYAKKKMKTEIGRQYLEDFAAEQRYLKYAKANNRSDKSPQGL